jgi:hypothetical protein
METREKHPSYVQVEICRTQGCGGNFYGTEIHPQHFITLKIYESEKVTDEILGERYYTHKNIVEIKMTAIQFAEMITTMNMFGGTPATLTRLNGVGVEECPIQKSKVSIAVYKGIDGIKETEQYMNKELLEMRNIALKNAGKKDSEEIKRKYNTLIGRFKSASEFYQEGVIESGIETISKIKVETANHITSKALFDTIGKQDLFNDTSNIGLIEGDKNEPK